MGFFSHPIFFSHWRQCIARTSGKVQASFFAILVVRQTQSTHRGVAQIPYTLCAREDVNGRIFTSVRVNPRLAAA
jgi:hypothetical protein